MTTAHAASFCPNCDTALGDNFCPHCGQPAHLHVPSAREFLHEFIAHYVALEGKLWRSLRLLLLRPGRLTNEYIHGRRVRYLEPLRLYLSFSIIFFALMKFSGHEVVHIGETPPPAAQVAAQPGAQATAAAAARAPADVPPQFSADPEENDLQRLATELHPSLGKKLSQFSALPQAEKKAAFKRAFFGFAPYAIFALMPLFAVFLKLLYLGSGRRYGEHFLFALHTNAFAFLLMSLLLILPSGTTLVGLALGLWLLLYLPKAMGVVYGGSRTVTALRWLVLMCLHTTAVLLAILAALSTVLVS